jgi:hypothetical protein
LAEIAETTSFLHYFSGLPDHRQAGKVDYPLPEVSHRDTKVLQYVSQWDTYCS